MIKRKTDKNLFKYNKLPDPEAINLPDGLKSTEVTGEVCLLNY
jgi:hypothetical protein